MSAGSTIPGGALFLTSFRGRELLHVGTPKLQHIGGHDALWALPTSLQPLALYGQLTQEQWQQCIRELNDLAGQSKSRGFCTWALVASAISSATCTSSLCMCTQ